MKTNTFFKDRSYKEIIEPAYSLVDSCCYKNVYVKPRHLMENDCYEETKNFTFIGTDPMSVFYYSKSSVMILSLLMEDTHML